MRRPVNSPIQLQVCGASVVRGSAVRPSLKQISRNSASNGASSPIVITPPPSFQSITQSVLPSVTSSGSFHLLREEIRSEEHTSELQSLMRISYAVFCLKKKKRNINE